MTVAINGGFSMFKPRPGRANSLVTLSRMEEEESDGSDEEDIEADGTVSAIADGIEIPSFVIPSVGNKTIHNEKPS